MLMHKKMFDPYSKENKSSPTMLASARENEPSDICAQLRLKSAGASAMSD